MADYSGINHALYRLKLETDEFVIGGVMAAVLSEPSALSKINTSTTELNISLRNFIRLSELPDVIKVSDKELSLRHGSVHLVFKAGIPVMTWTTDSGYKVMNPNMLRLQLEVAGLGAWAKVIQDVPEPKRMEVLERTPELAAFEKACQSFDWHYSYSDDNDVWRRGRDEELALQEQAQAMGKEAQALFAYYAVKR